MNIDDYPLCLEDLRMIGIPKSSEIVVLPDRNDDELQKRLDSMQEGLDGIRRDLEGLAKAMRTLIVKGQLDGQQ